MTSIQSGGETHGEEVGIEPNAQPQNLDSVKMSEEISSSVIALAAVTLPTPLLDSATFAIAAQEAPLNPTSPVTDRMPRGGRTGSGPENGLSRIRPQLEGGPSIDLQFPNGNGLPLGRPERFIEMPKPGQTPQDLLAIADGMGLNPQAIVVKQETAPGPIIQVGVQEMPRPGEANIKLEASADGDVISTQSEPIVGSSTNTESQSGSTEQGSGQSMGSGQQGQSGTQSNGATGAVNGVKGETKNEIDSAKGLTARERAEAVRQVQKGVERMNLRNSRESIQIRLEPEQLGSVVVELKRGVEGFTAMLQASNEPLREALQQSRGELAVGLAAKGVQDVKITVQATTESSNSQSSTSNSNQSHQGSQQHSARDQSRTQSQENFLRQFSFHANRISNSATQMWKRRPMTRLDIEI